MREFIGHKVKFAVEVLGMVEGTIVDDQRDRIFVKGSDGAITRVIKAHICAFTPLDFEPKDFVPFHVLHCFNKQTDCPGVRFIQEGAGVARNDFEAFMGPCPCRDETCEYGTKGELRSVAGNFLKEMLASTVYGDYPENNKEAKESGKRSGTASGTPERRPVKGPGTDAGEKPDIG